MLLSKHTDNYIILTDKRHTTGLEKQRISRRAYLLDPKCIAPFKYAYI
jgi:hypothetical protein